MPCRCFDFKGHKNLYKLAFSKKLKNLIGFNSYVKYEKSDYKVLTIKTNILSKRNL